MRVNLITNLATGGGLKHDADLLTSSLQLAGHTVNPVQFNQKQTNQTADLNIFLEVVVPEMFALAGRQWVIPNPEWWFPESTEQLLHFEYVLCKTRDSMKLMTPLAKDKVRYVGFKSRDLYDIRIPRERKWLHVGGNSMVKGTEAILEAWQSLSEPLTLVTRLKYVARLADKTPSCTVRYCVSDAELVHLMNSHQFHLCPSQYEGFGHYLHEGLGCGAAIITTNAAPMNEYGTPWDLLVKASPLKQLRLATLYSVDVADLLAKVLLLRDTPLDQLMRWSSVARANFITTKANFERRFLKLVQES